MLNLKKWMTKVNQWINLNKIRRTTVTGTTDSNGNLKLTLPENATVIIFAYDSERVFIPFWYRGYWYVRVQSTNAAGTAMTSTSITCTVFYIVGGGTA